jgi:hypothetical protein
VVTGGVFVNPALTEPFGLTLMEAAARGLPIVATEYGGPRDIIENRHNGVLVNPLEPNDIANGINEVLSDWETWQKRSLAGLTGVREDYSWTAHAEANLQTIRPVLDRTSAPHTAPSEVRGPCATTTARSSPTSTNVFRPIRKACRRSSNSSAHTTKWRPSALPPAAAWTSR